jgi:hypothetical protein
MVQCTQANAKQIVIFTDTINQAKVTIDPSPHSGQAHLLAVCAALQDWLLQDKECTVIFADVLSALRWSIYVQAHELATSLWVLWSWPGALY